MSGTIEIITDRLILRHPVMEDADVLTRAKKEVWPELQAWMSWASDGQDTLESTKVFIEHLGPHCLIGFCQKSGALALMTGLTPQAEPDVYETGYWVAKDFLGMGYATEGTCAAVHFAFDNLKAKKIVISHFGGNMKSRNVITKLGFSNEIIERNAHRSFLDGSVRDSHDFSMTDTSALPKIAYEWRGRW